MYLHFYTFLIISTGSALTMSKHSPLSARHDPFPSNLYIYTWTEPGCNDTNGIKTTVTQDHALFYSLMWPIGYAIQSYMLNRTLLPWEQLDWSAPYANGTMPDGGQIPEDCGVFLETINPDSDLNMLQSEICYPMINGASCVNILNTTSSPYYDAQTGVVEICET